MCGGAKWVQGTAEASLGMRGSLGPATALERSNLNTNNPLRNGVSSAIGLLVTVPPNVNDLTDCHTRNNSSRLLNRSTSCPSTVVKESTRPLSSLTKRFSEAASISSFPAIKTFVYHSEKSVHVLLLSLPVLFSRLVSLQRGKEDRNNVIPRAENSQFPS